MATPEVGVSQVGVSLDAAAALEDGRSANLSSFQQPPCPGLCPEGGSDTAPPEQSFHPHLLFCIPGAPTNIFQFLGKAISPQTQETSQISQLRKSAVLFLGSEAPGNQC